MINRRIRIFILSLALICISFGNTHAQDSLNFLVPAQEYKASRGAIVGIGLGTTYAVSMTGLYSLWYKDYPKSKFHSFDDNAEWLQVDKVGHFGTAYYLGKWGIDLCQWTGMKHRKATFLGGSLGFVFLTTVEIFDGYSSQWGFSTGDMIANVAGSAMAITQELAWNEQRIKVKFSFHQTKYARYRPDQLGENYVENLFKDYNGQAYWLSGNIRSFLHHNSKFPSWLNLAVGYGAEGMTGARSNIFEGDAYQTTRFPRYRQFYLAPDIDITKIKFRNKTLKTISGLFGFIKIPTPTFEYNSRGNLKFHILYF